MSSLSLREFIERREAEIRQERAALLNELKELRAAKAAIDPNAATLKDKPSLPTIKVMIQRALKRREGAGTAEQIIGWIHEDFGVQLVRTSVSPQLSRLKEDNILTLDDASREWCLLETERSSREIHSGGKSTLINNTGEPDETAID